MTSTALGAKLPPLKWTTSEFPSLSFRSYPLLVVLGATVMSLHFVRVYEHNDNIKSSESTYGV